MIALYILAGIVLLYIFTSGTRDSFRRRETQIIPALYETSKATLNKVLEQIRLNNDVLSKYKDWVAAIVTELAEGRRSPGSLVQAFTEQYPEALDGAQFGTLSAIINAGLNEFMISQKECFDEAYGYRGSRSSIWGWITCLLWRLPTKAYMDLEPKYLVSLQTDVVQKAFESGVMPTIELTGEENCKIDGNNFTFQPGRASPFKVFLFLTIQAVTIHKKNHPSGGGGNGVEEAYLKPSSAKKVCDIRP